ncbi:MAG: tetratricopeptide repeat protein [Spirochaetes bacterium]|nr:tetratricopeptide repeat protein [Spirochaetota bacterium]MBU0955039.1 tetratricopeptide repeat protein [Spirochaetota bacterium]
MKRLNVLLFLVCLSAASLASCRIKQDYYIHSDLAEKDTVRELLALYPEASTEEKFAIVQEVSGTYLLHGENDRAISYLSGVIESNPDFIYNTHFMLSIAWAYTQKKADSIAVLYLDRILKNYPDLLVRGESIHYSSLQRLLQLVQEPTRRIEYRRDLIERFPDKINLGTEYFLLGKDYEKAGEWDAALNVYKQFILHHNQEVPGHLDAIQYAKNLVDLNATRKDWTYESLDELLRNVKTALATRNVYRLGQLRSKVGFFAMDWHQDKNEGNSQMVFDFSAFIAGGRIYYAETLDSASNAQEAFLRSWGWTDRIPIMYLYFRKINFPADPEFHGRWEWAGIYFGEKLQ